MPIVATSCDVHPGCTDDGLRPKVTVIMFFQVGLCKGIVQTLLVPKDGCHVPAYRFVSEKQANGEQ